MSVSLDFAAPACHFPAVPVLHLKAVRPVVRAIWRVGASGA
jgi:hypothetical protein